MKKETIQAAIAGGIITGLIIVLHNLFIYLYPITL